MRPVLAVLLLTACSLNTSRFAIRHDREVFKVDQPTIEDELPNGLKLLFLPAPGSGLVEVDVRYAVGSRDDPPEKPGMAHLVEHLMYTQRIGGPNQPTLGGRLRAKALLDNAFTTEDSTHYLAIGRPDTVEELLTVQAARLVIGCGTLTQKTLDREREVVKNEIRESSGRVLRASLQSLLYPKDHPYSHSAGGSSDGLDRIGLDDVCAFIAAQYTAGRALLVVAGDVTGERLGPALAHSFAALPRRPAAPRAPLPEVVSGPRTLTLEMDVDAPMIFAAWPVAPSNTMDGSIAPLGLARFGGAMNRRSWYSSGFIGGTQARFAVYSLMVADEADVDRARAGIVRDMENMDRYMASANRLDYLRCRMVAALMIGMDSLMSRVFTFASWRELLGPGTELSSLLDRYEGLDDAKIRDVLVRTFNEKKVTWIIVRPKAGGAATAWRPAELPDFDGAATDELPVDPSEASRALQTTDTAFLLAGAESFELPNGLHVYLAPLPSPMPIVTVQLSFPVGTATDPAGHEGVALMAATVLEAEASRANAWRYYYEDDSDVDADETTFRLRGLDIHLDVLLATIAGRLHEGDYPRRLDLEDRDVAPPVTLARQRATLAATRAVLGALYGQGHPYAHPLDIAPEDVRALAPDMLHDFKRHHYVAGNGVLVISGRFDPAAARRLAMDLFGDLQAGTPETPIPAIAPPSRPTHLGIITQEAAASVPVILGWPAGATSDPRYPARLVLAELLDERMRFVRERLAASYGVSARLDSRGAGDVYQIRGQVDARRAGDVLRAMRAEVAALHAGDIAPEQFARARHKAMASLWQRPTSSSDAARQVDWLARHRLPLTGYADLIRKVAELTQRDIVELSRVDLAPEHEVAALAGSRPVLEAAFAAAGIADARFIGR